MNDLNELKDSNEINNETTPTHKSFRANSDVNDLISMNSSNEVNAIKPKFRKGRLSLIPSMMENNATTSNVNARLVE